MKFENYNADLVHHGWAMLKKAKASGESGGEAVKCMKMACDKKIREQNKRLYNWWVFGK